MFLLENRFAGRNLYDNITETFSLGKREVTSSRFLSRKQHFFEFLEKKEHSKYLAICKTKNIVNENSKGLLFSGKFFYIKCENFTYI